MAVEVRYLVIRDGKEVGMYTSKKDADAHDKMLDIAESLFSFMEKAGHIDLKEEQLEELSIYLSSNREEVIRILKGGPSHPAPDTASENEETSPQEENPPDAIKERRSRRTDK